MRLELTGASHRLHDAARGLVRYDLASLTTARRSASARSRSPCSTRPATPPQLDELDATATPPARGGFLVLGGMVDWLECGYPVEREPARV